MNMNQSTTNLFKLISRSSDIGDGWRKVSKVLSTFIELEIQKAPELFEVRRVDDGLQIRFSDTGKTLVDYI